MRRNDGLVGVSFEASTVNRLSWRPHPGVRRPHTRFVIVLCHFYSVRPSNPVPNVLRPNQHLVFYTKERQGARAAVRRRNSSQFQQIVLYTFFFPSVLYSHSLTCPLSGVRSLSFMCCAEEEEKKRTVLGDNLSWQCYSALGHCSNAGKARAKTHRFHAQLNIVLCYN